MAGKLLPDDVWREIEPLLPVRQGDGRPPTDARRVLTTILFALRYDIPWRALPSDLGCSYKTCLRRLREWRRCGVWDLIEGFLLARLEGAESFDWSRVRQADKPSSRAQEAREAGCSTKRNRAQTDAPHRPQASGVPEPDPRWPSVLLVPTPRRGW